MTDTENRALQRQRQRAESLRSSRSLERRSFSVRSCEVRDGAGEGEPIRFSGYASLTETPYTVGDFTETIQRGAFKRTLKENPDVVFRVEHQGLPLARTERPDSTSPGTLRLEETERGLKVDAEFDPEDPDAQNLRRKMLNGLVDEMSFAFRCTDDAWNEDWTDRTVKSVTLHGGDVSAVTFGASPTTGSTTSIRSADGDTELRARYTDAQVEVLGKEGKAFLNSDGHYSYPVVDAQDLSDAIRAVGRGNAEHEAIRRFIMARATKLKLGKMIPATWQSDGSLAGRSVLLDLDKALADLETLIGDGRARDAERVRRTVENDDTEECPVCAGTGRVVLGGRKCEACGGSGEVDKSRKPIPGGYEPPSRSLRRELARRAYFERVVLER